MADGNDAKPRLLAIDDDLPLAELISRAAEKCGYEARALDQSHQLARLLDGWMPDVLTLDLSMPEEDGMSMLALLEEKRFAGMLIIISGHQGWLRKAACRLAQGRGLDVVEDFQKPVDITALRQVLKRLHPGRHRGMELAS
jgi:two-component system, chemotaxis family, chemotaxis protein CheY